MCDYDQPILLYMLFIIVRFQLWSLIRTRLSLLRCWRPVAICFTPFLFSTAATLMSIITGKRQEEVETRMYKAYCHGYSCITNHCWTVGNSIQREYAVYNGAAVSSIHSFSTRLSLPLFFFSPSLPYLYYYKRGYTMLSLRCTSTWVFLLPHLYHHFFFLFLFLLFTGFYGASDKDGRFL